MHICKDCEFNKSRTVTRHLSGCVEIAKVRRCMNEAKWGKKIHTLLPSNAKKCTGYSRDGC